MLFKTDSLFGHVIEERGDGAVVYQDDGTEVDFSKPRGCAGCQAPCQEGEHDPCIANLPGTLNACCGHGLELSPVSRRPNGYVALADGRSFRFSGKVGGQSIRQAVALALAGEPLPDGFVYDEQQMWWSGLSDRQRQYVQDNILRGLAELVTRARHGEAPSPRFLAGEAMWWDGLTEDEKSEVLSGMAAMIATLVEESRIACP